MKFIFSLIFLVIGCGSDPEYIDAPPAPPRSGPPSTVSFAAAKVVIDEQCASAGCHAGAAFTQNAAAFKASTSRKRIISGSMPKKSGPNYQIYNNAKKKTLLDFLSN